MKNPFSAALLDYVATNEIDQKELSKTLKIHYSTFNRYVSGKYIPPGHVMCHILCTLFGPAEVLRIVEELAKAKDIDGRFY